MTTTDIQPAFTVEGADDIRARQRRAMELRARAWSPREIAQELGVTTHVVSAWIAAAVREHIPTEVREQVRALQLDRYEVLLKAYFEILATCTTVEQLEKIGRLCVQTMTRIDVLAGTERPKEVRLDGQIVPIGQLDLELAEMIREAKARAAAEEAEIRDEDDEDEDVFDG
jgi:predicted transcriptional regulator